MRYVFYIGILGDRVKKKRFIYAKRKMFKFYFLFSKMSIRNLSYFSTSFINWIDLFHNDGLWKKAVLQKSNFYLFLSVLGMKGNISVCRIHWWERLYRAEWEHCNIILQLLLYFRLKEKSDRKQENSLLLGLIEQ